MCLCLKKRFGGMMRLLKLKRMKDCGLGGKLLGVVVVVVAVLVPVVPAAVVASLQRLKVV